ncbi:hypothetical protein [Oceanobacillus profundus]|uniref:hypothetical protein n=1 Tax=Oceanobacillus profundus TaxID=372463 RepID=UPI000BA7A651|nr:hypothetical protein [Oceanobacillus profundus]MDO6449341.1 hypothetical protein [Oceanobacillus profundus]PAE26999.1 hypothetical protein CHI07_21765 [Paenibacillus sp. 7884-2]
MNTTSRNYWSLYVEFLEAFKDLKYKGFSIPYLCHFRSLNHRNNYIWEHLSSEEFIKSLSHEVKDKKTMQQIFSSYKQTHINRKGSKLFKKASHANGKVVLYDVYNLMRFPKEIMTKHFPPADTIFLQDYNPKEQPKVIEAIPEAGIPSHYLDEYRVNVSSNIQILKGKVDEIISTYTDHPMFNNETFKQYFYMQIEGIVNRIEETNRYFRMNPVSCIVFSSTHYYQSRTIAMVAAEMGIPTICMQHGIIGDEIGYMPKIADVDAVYSNFEVNWFKQLGLSDQAVEIIGHPRFDAIHQGPSISKNELEKQLELKPNKKMILMIVRGKIQMEKWETFIDNFDGIDNYNIVIKDFRYLKPHELTAKSPDVYPSKHFQLYDLIHHSDLVVSYISTVGLEAMIAKKPVFVLSSPFPTYTGYFDFLDELAQPDPLIITEMINNYFIDEKFKELVEEKREAFLSQAYPAAKPSGDRLVDLINRLAN